MSASTVIFTGNHTFMLPTENMKLNEMEDCSPGHAISRKDEQIVEIQKRDKT